MPTRLLPLDQGFDRWDDLLSLIISSFSYMDNRIAPPSSALSLTSESLAAKAQAEIGYLAFEDDELVGCMFLRPEPDCLYVGKLAVAPHAQRRGIGRRLMAVAEDIARERELSMLRLETRIELVENHAAFSAWGFKRTAENSHPGFDRITSVEMRKFF